MPALRSKELRIVGFLCNWCSYGGADTAGVGRFTQPTDLRIIRVPCSGRIDPLFVVKALLHGADGVLVSGCHPRDCHYSQGNFYARRRLEALKRFLPIIGVDPSRFEYTWVSASEGQRWQKVVTSFTERIHTLGTAPRFEEAEIPSSLSGIPRRLESAAARLPSNGKNQPDLHALKDRIRAELPGLDCVIGWEQGFDPLHCAPLFIRSPEDVERLIWGPLNLQNPATYLASFRGKKVGVVVKGCDSRSLVQLLQEKLVNRDDLAIFGMPCSGVADLSKVRVILEGLGASIDRVDSVVADRGTLTVTVDGKSYPIAMLQAAADKCLHCQFPNAVMADHFVGEPVLPADPAGNPPPDLVALDAMDLRERMVFWRFHMERCIRCHACRNVCPLCVCQDHCIAQSRNPHWISQEDTATEKILFQVVHAVHLAGRCTECGECERVCPMGIPVLALKRYMSRVIHDLFDYRAGTDPQAVPPLLTFQADEKNICEGS